MRATVNIDDELLRRAKEEALRSGRTLTALIEDSLRAALARAPDNASQEGKFVIEPFRGRGLRPGVDLDDTDALLDLMEQR